MNGVSDALDALGAATAARAQAGAEEEARWRAEILAAVKAKKVPVIAIARAAGISRTRLYDILQEERDRAASQLTEPKER